jgi:hypothetical protein
MSSLGRDDKDMHYTDHGHRWVAPPGIDQATWEGKVRAHLADHRESLIPRQRNRRAVSTPAGDYESALERVYR